MAAVSQLSNPINTNLKTNKVFVRWQTESSSHDIVFLDPKSTVGKREIQSKGFKGVLAKLEVITNQCRVILRKAS